MLTSVINPRVVLIVCLICHDEKSTRKSYFAKQVQVQVQLYTEWNDNHVCIINQIKSVKGAERNSKSYMMGWEKVPCELKDHIQHGLIKQRHVLTKVSAR